MMGLHFLDFLENAAAISKSQTIFARPVKRQRLGLAKGTSNGKGKGNESRKNICEKAGPWKKGKALRKGQQSPKAF